MKILELIPSLQSAGAEKFVVELSNELSHSKDVEINIATLYSKRDGDLLASLVKPNIPVFFLNKGDGFSIKCMFKMLSFLRTNRYDVVHVHLSAIPYILLPAIFLRNIKFCATIHSEAKREADGLITTLIRKFLFKNRLCQPVTISEESNKSFVSFYHLQAPIIYNGIRRIEKIEQKDPFIDDRKRGATILIHIARTHKIKNQIVLYKCINRLAEEGYNLVLYHFGRFYDQEVAKQLMAEKSDRIKIPGEILDVESVLRFSDAMCLSSLMEGMPMTIIEAFSVGCPVICTPVGGCVNMVKDGVNGFLSANTSEESYYQALKQFMDLKDKDALSAGAYDSFEIYDIKKSAKMYYELFKSRNK